MALGLSPVIVVGADCGTEICLELVRRYANCVRGAILCAPLITAREAGWMEGPWSGLICALETAATPRAAVDAFFRTVSGGSWERLSQSRREAARSNHAALMSSLLGNPDGIAPEDLRAIAVPLRIVTGTRSLSFVQQSAATVVEHVPNTDLVQLAGAGLFPNADDPLAFSEAIRSFARRLASTAAEPKNVIAASRQTWLAP